MSAKKTVFLLAHQDDEMGVFYEIERRLRSGEDLHFLYLTSGAWEKATPEARAKESIAVLARLGVMKAAIQFPGTESAIPDGRLADHLPAIWRAVDARLDALEPIDRLVTHAWEGGHQDHDAAHWLTRRQAEKRGILTASRVFPLYRAALGAPLPFVVARPLPALAERAERKRIPISRRLAYLRACFTYETQRKAMIGLLPFLAWDYFASGMQKLLPLDAARLDQRPHEGPLLYEARKRYRFEDLAARLAEGEALTV